jgi:hypothetical protein
VQAEILIALLTAAAAAAAAAALPAVTASALALHVLLLPHDGHQPKARHMLAGHMQCLSQLQQLLLLLMHGIGPSYCSRRAESQQM